MPLGLGSMRCGGSWRSRALRCWAARKAAISCSALRPPDRVVDHSREGIPGLWSIVGGKLTTHRSLAEQTVDRAGRWLRGQTGSERPKPFRRAAASDAWDLAALCRSVSGVAEGLGLDEAQI